MANSQKRSMGSIIKKKSSGILYVKAYFFGKSFEITSELPDTAENRAMLRTWLTTVMDDHYAGNLDFSDKFPGAKPEWKLFYAQKNASLFDLKRKDVLVATHIEEMKKSFIGAIKNKSMQIDYLNAINARLLPFFKEKGLTFADITPDCMLKLAKSFYKANGEPLSRSRISKLITALRLVISYANTTYGWQPQPDPFWIIKKVAEIAEARESTRVLTYDEFMRILTAIDSINPWYRPIVELMVLTGMIPSEIAGLKSAAIKGNYIIIKNSVVMDTEKSGNKNIFRTRNILITSSIRRVLDEIIKRNKNPKYIVTMEDGKAFAAEKFRKNIWTPVLAKAGVEYEKPYCLRHTFIAWALLADMQPYVLSGITGHASKRMIYDVYGKYVPGLENDRPSIIEYLGDDFVSENKRLHR